MTYYYRLAQIPNTLPTHWAYSDAWEFNSEQGSWVDNREEGFQVFSSIIDAAAAALGHDVDGYYKGYSQLLQLDCDKDYVMDGGDRFYAISPGGLISAKAVDTESFIMAVTSLFEKEKEEYNYETILSWLEDSEEDITELFECESQSVDIEYIETLGKPQIMEVA